MCLRVSPIHPCVSHPIWCVAVYVCLPCCVCVSPLTCMDRAVRRQSPSWSVSRRYCFSTPAAVRCRPPPPLSPPPLPPPLPPTRRRWPSGGGGCGGQIQLRRSCVVVREEERRDQPVEACCLLVGRGLAGRRARLGLGGVPSAQAIASPGTRSLFAVCTLCSACAPR